VTVAAPPPERRSNVRSAWHRWRPLIWAAIVVAIAGLAMLVARPRVDPAAAVPYGGKRGASLAHSSGLRLSWQRGLDVQVLKPGTTLRSGDLIRFVVRADRPRYLEIRARDPLGQERTIFPGGEPGQPSAQVQPDQALTGAMVLDETPGKEIVMSLFGDHPFPIGRPPAADLEVAEIELVKGP
jgi:hypothetical protein